MSLKSISNMLVSSVAQSLDKRLVVGKTSTKAISLLNVLKKSFEYAIAKYNSGEEDYFKDITQLNLKIQKLKYECPDICSFRDKFIFENSLPISIPSISDNTITRNLMLDFQVLPQAQVIYNYENEDESGVAKMKITSRSNTLLLNIDNQPVDINQVYTANLGISVKLDTSINTYLSKIDGVTCSIIAVNTTAFNDAINAGHRILSINDDYSVTFQYLSTGSGGASTLINYVIDGIYIGEVIEEEFMLRIQSFNNTQIWSNSAKITILFTVDCETVETCDANLQKTIPHIQSYIFTPEDFGLIGDYDKIMYIGSTYDTGSLRWKEHPLISNNNVPIVITKQDLINGDLYWFPSSTSQQILTMNFKIAKENSYNYCNNSSNFTLTKLQANG